MTAAADEPCGRCGEVHTACMGHVGSGATFRACRKVRMRGQLVCSTHGGSSPQALAKAARRLEERRVESELGKVLAAAGESAAGLGAEEVLLEQLWRAAAMARLLETLVGERGEDGLLGRNHHQERTEHPYAGMLRQWTGEAARLAKLALDANIDQRRVAIAEGQAQMLAAVLRTGMTGLLDAVRALGVLDAAVVRQLEDQVPALLRTAIQTTVIDTTKDASASTPKEESDV